MPPKYLKDWPILKKLDTTDYRKVFVFEHNAVILNNSGSIFGIGINGHNLISANDETFLHENLSAISHDFKVTDITTNGEHALAISEEGFLYSWGSNKDGQLGRDGECHKLFLVENVFAMRIKEAACGTGFSCVLTEGGKVFEWGINGYYEITLESDGTSDHKVSEIEKIISIQGTKYYPVILTESGKVFVPPLLPAREKCNNCMHSKKLSPIEGLIKNKKIIQVLSCKYYVIALSSCGEIFQWPIFPSIPNDIERVGEGIGRVVKLWASSSRDVVVAADDFGNLSSIIRTDLGVPVAQINVSPAEKFFAKLNMPLQGPVYDKGSLSFDLAENTDALSEWRGRFEAAFNRKEDSDISFVVGGEYIYAHQAILSIQSTYLNAFLKNNWKEISEDKQIIIKQYTYPTYLRYVKFLYSGMVEQSSHENNVELLKLAHDYMEKTLLHLCEKMIIQELTAENALSMYDIANNFGLEEMRQACRNFIGKNLENVILSEDILDLDESSFIRCVRDMVCSKNIVGPKEEGRSTSVTAPQVKDPCIRTFLNARRRTNRPQ